MKRFEMLNKLNLSVEIIREAIDDIQKSQILANDESMNVSIDFVKLRVYAEDIRSYSNNIIEEIEFLNGNIEEK